MASGANVGTGLGLFVGGYTLDAWNSIYPDSQLAPFGLKGWQASIAPAFFIKKLIFKKCDLHQICDKYPSSHNNHNTIFNKGGLGQR